MVSQFYSKNDAEKLHRRVALILQILLEGFQLSEEDRQKIRDELSQHS